MRVEVYSVNEESKDEALTVGDTPPASPEDGIAVASGRARSVVDAGLPPDTIHTYAVFARGQGDGLPPAAVTTATLPVGPRSSSAASYSMLAHASVVEPRDADVVSLVGDEVWVELEPSRAVPVTGAGMALPVSDALPGGFLGIVEEVAPDGRSVRLEEAGLHQVFARYELSTSFQLDASGTPRRPALCPDPARDLVFCSRSRSGGCCSTSSPWWPSSSPT